MTVFSAAIDAIFRDPNMAADVSYTAIGTGATTTVRAVRISPDESFDLGGARVSTATSLFDIRVSEVAQPVAGDTITVGEEEFTVQGIPERDAQRLVWRLDTRPGAV